MGRAPGLVLQAVSASHCRASCLQIACRSTFLLSRRFDAHIRKKWNGCGAAAKMKDWMDLPAKTAATISVLTTEIAAAKAEAERVKGEKEVLQVDCARLVEEMAALKKRALDQQEEINNLRCADDWSWQQRPLQLQYVLALHTKLPGIC